MQIKLTKRTVEGLPLPAAGVAFWRDEGLPGFGVRVTSSGYKAFIFERRIEGRPQRITLGRYGDITVEEARKQAERLAGAIASGRNPVVERRRLETAQITLGAAMEEYFGARELKAKTKTGMAWEMQSLFPDWMDRPLSAITPEMARQRHAEVGERSKARANLGMRYLRAVFNFFLAEHTAPDGSPLLPANPVDRLTHTRSWFRIPRRQTVIAPQSLERWAQAVRSLPNTAMQDYLVFVLLTGLRREEAMGLEWADVNFDTRMITITDTKAHRPHVLPLSTFLWELLSRRQDTRPDKSSSYVFADSAGRRLSNPRYALDAVREASGVSFCIHDLRRTFATVAESLDIPAYVLKRLLNHATSGDVTAGYIISTPERLREPMQKITDFMLEKMGPEPAVLNAVEQSAG